MSDTKTLLVVSGGAAVDAILVPADATVGKNGASAAWGDAEFPAPAGSIFVDQPDAAIGWRLVKGELVAPTPPVEPPLTPEQLAALKAGLKVQVDSAAEALRLTLITPGSGQAMEYQEAYAQAQAALAATDAVEPAAYPMLAATIGVDIDPESGKPAADVLGVARSVKAAYEAYLQAGAAIRGARLLAKVEIDAAPDADHARAVFGAIQWPF